MAATSARMCSWWTVREAGPHRATRSWDIPSGELHVVDSKGGLTGFLVSCQWSICVVPGLSGIYSIHVWNCVCKVVRHSHAPGPTAISTHGHAEKNTGTLVLQTFVSKTTLFVCISVCQVRFFIIFMILCGKT